MARLPGRPHALPTVTMAAAFITLLASASAAHDYWLAPEPENLRAGDICTIRLLVGDRLQPELERPLQRSITSRYEWLAADDTVDLLPTTPDGTTPVFRGSIPQATAGLLVMDRDFVTIESTYDQFVQFLEHEEAVALLERARRVPGDRLMRRRYARNLKALVRVDGADVEGLHSRRVGQDLEILLLDDPWSLEAGATLGVRVLSGGEPLEGEWVRRFVATGGGGVEVQAARTDGEGTARIPVDASGLWVLRVALVRPGSEPDKADWDTRYATFSFQVPLAARESP